MDLAIIILNWHAADDTIACVRSLQSWQNIQPAIYVVDNASNDDSLAQIQASCPNITLIANTENQGFSGGSNRGIEATLQQNNAPILLLNNDAHIAETDVDKLLQSLQCDQVGLVVPVLRDAEGNFISAGGKNPVLHFQTRIRQMPDEQAIFDVDFLSGTAVLIKAQVFRQIGLLDEAYFFSTELADFCTRARYANYRCVVNPQAQAIHKTARSSALRGTLYTYYIVRNRFIFLKKFYLPPVRLALFAFWSLYSLALSLKLKQNDQTATARAVYLALQDAWQNRFGGQNERVLAFVNR